MSPSEESRGEGAATFPSGPIPTNAGSSLITIIRFKYLANISSK